MPETEHHGSATHASLPGPFQLEALLDAIPDSLYVCTRDGLIQDCRPASDRRHWPLPPGGAVGIHVRDLLDPHLAERIVQTIGEALDTGLPRTIEYAVPTPGGPAYREARIVRYGPDTVLVLVRDVDARHRAELEREQLLSSLDGEQRQLRAVLDQLPAMMVICDAAGRVIRANRHFLERVGISEADLLGRAYTELPFDTVDASGQSIPKSELPSARALRGEHVSTEVGVLGPGGPRWLHVLAAPIRNERGQLDGAILTLRDLTDERAAADALRRSEATNRALLNAIPDALYRVSRAGVVLERRAPDDGRFRLHEVYAGRHLTDLLGQEVGGLLAQAIEATLRHQRARTVEYTWKGDELVLHREARMVPFGQDEVLMLIRDIGERRRAEAEREQLLQTLDDERRQLAAILQQIPNTLIVIDRDGRIVRVNQGFLDALGVTRDAVVGRISYQIGTTFRYPDGRLVDPADLPSKAALAGREVSGELIIERPDGQQRWVRISAAPIRDDHGAVTGAIIATVNVAAEREAMAALRASEQRNRALLDAIPDMICVGRRDGTIVDYKPPTEARPGTPHDVLGKRAADLWPVETVDTVMKVVDRVLDAGRPETVELDFSTPYGDQHREVRLVPYGDEQVLALVRDVTARRRAEEERERLLRQVDGQRRRLDTILRQLPHTLIVLDRAGRIEEVNDGFMASVGLPKEQIVGHTTQQLGATYRHPDGRLLRPDEMPSVVALSGREYTLDVQITGVTGRVSWSHIVSAPIRDEHGEVTGAIIATRDITAEREAIAALQASEARIRALLDAIPDSIYVRSRDGVLLDFKPAGDGRPMLPAPVLRRTLTETHANEPGQQFQQVIDATIATGQLQTFEYLVPTPAGPAYREARVVPAGPDRVLALVRDIDARKRAEQQLYALNQELEARVRARTAELEAANHELEAFSYSVSHDLKAPLRGIDGYSRLLWEDYQDRLDDDGRELLWNVRQGAAQMYQLIDDLLAYSRLERRPLDRRQIALRLILDGLLDERATEIAARGVRLHVDVPEVTVRADREGLAQALRNLLENALRFTASRAVPEIVVRATAQADCCILSVRDNGVGFDMAYHDRIFEIFQRLHRTEEYPGTGIGLALVRKAMQRMGGRVWAESVPGEGATFYLQLPLSSDDDLRGEAGR